MKYFFKNIEIVIVILIIISGLNYWIDPGKKFSNYYMLEDGNILITQNLDERLLKTIFIEKDKNKKESIILGSSRIMTLSLNDNKVINLGVSGANLKDDLALLYNYIIINEKLPKRIILGIDPWVFNTTEDKRYKILEESYLSMEKVITTEKERVKKINHKKEVLNFFQNLGYLLKISTFKDSLIVIFKNKGIINRKLYEIVPTKIDDKGNIFLFLDRSMNYSKKFINLSNNNKERWKSYRDYQLNNFNRINKDMKNKLKNFVEWTKKNKIELIIYLPPYNPLHYENYIKSSPYEMLFNNIEIYIRNIGQKNDVKVLGGYYIPELTDEDFYDGIHLKSEILNEYFIRNNRD